MKTLKISEFKASCIRVLKTVARTAEPVLVTRRGKPLARVLPVREERPRARVLGGLKGAIEIRGDIIGSDFEDDWEGGR
ncbi:MAG TPA: type II toxin-antitoxin system prevent-host-death family antitoxin [Planctomycetes bacterium]|nr:type II toxin-antitoxin system prevent-host-death family antitoxin [Planctomycetota bacterium]